MHTLAHTLTHTRCLCQAFTVTSSHFPLITFLCLQITSSFFFFFFNFFILMNFFISGTRIKVVSCAQPARSLLDPSSILERPRSGQLLCNGFFFSLMASGDRWHSRIPVSSQCTAILGLRPQPASSSMPLFLFLLIIRSFLWWSRSDSPQTDKSPTSLRS